MWDRQIKSFVCTLRLSQKWGSAKFKSSRCHFDYSRGFLFSIEMLCLGILKPLAFFSLAVYTELSQEAGLALCGILDGVSNLCKLAKNTFSKNLSVTKTKLLCALYYGTAPTLTCVNNKDSIFSILCFECSTVTVVLAAGVGISKIAPQGPRSVVVTIVIRVQLLVVYDDIQFQPRASPSILSTWWGVSMFSFWPASSFSFNKEIVRYISDNLQLQVPVS